MKTIFIVLLLCFIVSGLHAQEPRVYQKDSMKVGKDSVTFLVNAKHVYNSIYLKALVVTDTIKVYTLNESGDRAPAALRDLNTYTDLEGNKICGLSGNHEFLILHPNVYRFTVKWGRVITIPRTIKVDRRGNNLK
jgi:hypothetical protein